MSDAKLTFDADTASYDARMDASHKKTGHLVEGFKDMAEPLLKAVTILGTAELAIDAIKERYDTWLEQIKKAHDLNKLLYEDLSGIAGLIGLTGQAPELRKAVASSQGPLNTQEKVKAVGAFADVAPGSGIDSVKEALEQTQKAASVVGSGTGTDRFIQALGIGIQAGLSQKIAGDVAIAVAQSGSGGAEAFNRIAGKFSEQYDTPEARQKADFLKYAKSTTPEELGIRPTQVIGFRNLQKQLGGATGLDRQAELAERDPILKEEIERRRRDAGTETNTQQRYGPRAELEEEIKSRSERAKSLGLSGRTGIQSLRSEAGLRQILSIQQAEINAAEGRDVEFPGVRREDAAREFARSRARDITGTTDGGSVFKAQEARILKALEGIHRNTAEPQGAPRFRNEAQDRDKGEP